MKNKVKEYLTKQKLEEEDKVNKDKKDMNEQKDEVRFLVKNILS